jgi:methylmalonyl-CoA/ethylmalonyl-CoA epimerase
MSPDSRVRLHLHHVGYAVATVEPITELFVRRFGYEVCTGVIHDPAQTAYAQFLRLPGEHTYLELVAPDAPDSKLSGAIRRGGGLHHLCYSVDDIETATHELSATGMMILAPPVAAVAFNGRRVAWLCSEDGALTELLERGSGDGL